MLGPNINFLGFILISIFNSVPSATLGYHAKMPYHSQQGGPQQRRH